MKVSIPHVLPLILQGTGTASLSIDGGLLRRWNGTEKQPQEKYLSVAHRIGLAHECV